MGHTLVTRFDEAGYALIRGMLGDAPANKIPFGRGCDREAADRVLKHHVTVLHWGRDRNEQYLKRLESFRFRPCSVRVTGVSLLPGAEGSLLLCLTAEPGEGFSEMAAGLEAVMQTPTERMLHITLAVNKDHEAIQALHRGVQETAKFPLLLRVTGLDLYHIWKPTSYVRCYQ